VPDVLRKSLAGRGIAKLWRKQKSRVGRRSAMSEATGIYHACVMQNGEEIELGVGRVGPDLLRIVGL
jgi:hypothetical protein